MNTKQKMSKTPKAKIYIKLSPKKIVWKAFNSPFHVVQTKKFSQRENVKGTKEKLS